MTDPDAHEAAMGNKPPDSTVDTVSPFLPWPLYRILALSYVTWDLKHVAECNELLEAALTTQLERARSAAANRAMVRGRGRLTLSGPRSDVPFHKFGTLFPGMVRSSLFLSCYALLESRLDELCTHLQGCHNLRISPADLRDKGLTRARIYIAKVAGMRFPSNSESWETIQKLGRVRNLLAHAGGRITEAKDRRTIAALTTAHPGAVGLDGSGQVELSSTFMPFVMRTFRSFFRELYTTDNEPVEHSAL